jgi:hypothetical protein
MMRLVLSDLSALPTLATGRAILMWPDARVDFG